MQRVFNDLYKTKRIIVIPIAEIGCYFQKSTQRPLFFEGNITNFIKSLKNFVLKEKVQLSGTSFLSVLVHKNNIESPMFSRIPVDHDWSADEATEVSFGQINTAKGRINVMPAF